MTRKKKRIIQKDLLTTSIARFIPKRLKKTIDDLPDASETLNTEHAPATLILNTSNHLTYLSLKSERNNSFDSGIGGEDTLDSYNTPPPIRKVLPTHSTPISKQHAKSIDALQGCDFNSKIEAVTLVKTMATKILTSTPVRNRYDKIKHHSEHALQNSDLNDGSSIAKSTFNLSISNPLDMLALHIQTTEISPTKHRNLFKITNCMDKTSTVEVLSYPTGGQSALIRSLGTYDSIARYCDAVIKQSPDLTESLFAQAIRDTFLGIKSEIVMKLNDSELQLVSDLVSLLFFTESSRDQGALITNQMFIDLIIDEQTKILDMPQILPMAIRGAVKVTRTLDDIVFIDVITHNTRYDYSKNVWKTAQKPEIAEFVLRTNTIVKLWLRIDTKSSISDDLVESVDDIVKRGIEPWYGLKLRPFYITETEICHSRSIDDEANMYIFAESDLESPIFGETSYANDLPV